ncbi:hypothetical protein LTS18_009825, partial [Coniosporium uncinatum]
MGLEETPGTSAESAQPKYGILQPLALAKKPTSSSYTSTRFADSAYASASMSGRNSTAPSGQDDESRRMSKTAMSRQQQNVQSYLHDIPAGLLPNKHTIAMTERSKKKLVVRRMEQVFAGKSPVADGHQHRDQQEEVAQAAAQADRKAIEATGQRPRQEGLREARIMAEETEDPAQPNTSNHPVQQSVQNLKPSAHVDEHDFAGSSSPAQRPTRPLDLDPERAQFPAENMRYIRHLGFSPNDTEPVDEVADDHGWMYLNLLINMAQLHTLNVTPDFVQKALQDYSNFLELSSDGRKVRWKGGDRVTCNSSDSSPEGNFGLSSSSSATLRRKGSQKKQLRPIRSREQSFDDIDTAQWPEKSNKLNYIPLFHRKALNSEEEDEDSDDPDDSWSSRGQDDLTGNSSGLTSSGVRTGSKMLKRGDDGPIIFYNRVKFCTDLSGDRVVEHLTLNNNKNYRPVATAPVGAPSVPNRNAPSESFEPRGPLGYPAGPVDRMDIDEDSTTSDLEASFLTVPSVTPLQAPSTTKPVDLEVSGIG